MKKVLVFLTLTVALLMCFVSCVLQPVHTHKFTEWSTTKNATCTEDGIKTRYCECGEKQSDVLPAIGHNYIDGECANCGDVKNCKHENLDVLSGKESTCTETGLTEGMKCLNCETMVVPQMVIPITECIDLKTLPYKAPTCQETGLTEGKQCNICGTMVVPQSIIPIAECTDLKILPYKAPTCQETGLTAGKQCNICGTVVVEQDVLFKIDCVESNWIVDKEATKTEDGNKHTECTMCHRTIKDVLIHAGSQGLSYELNDDGKSYSVTKVGTCTDTDIVIPRAYNGLPVTSIGDYAFDNCTSLTSVVIPDSVASIGEGTFFYCTSLTSVVIGDSVTSIGEMAFYCTSLTSVVIGDSVTSIGEMAFYYCTSLTSVVIPDSVTTIGNSAFYDCTSLTSVVIGDGVTSIGEGAFYDCTSLTSVVIPDSVASIGWRSFSNCSSLTSIDVNDNNQNYKSTDGNLYSKDGKTLIQYAKGKQDSSFVIPDSVTSIGDDAFCCCDSLTSVVIGDSVTSIGSSAFFYCTSLGIINFEGTVEQWNAIQLEPLWNVGAPATYVQCSDGIVPLN